MGKADDGDNGLLVLKEGAIGDVIVIVVAAVALVKGTGEVPLRPSVTIIAVSIFTSGTSVANEEEDISIGDIGTTFVVVDDDNDNEDDEETAASPPSTTSKSNSEIS